MENSNPIIETYGVKRVWASCQNTSWSTSTCNATSRM